MIKALESAIEKVKVLPPDTQALAARLLEEVAEVRDPELFRVPLDHLAAIQEGLAEADRREFVSAADMERFWKQCGQ